MPHRGRLNVLVILFLLRRCDYLGHCLPWLNEYSGGFLILIADEKSDFREIKISLGCFI